MRHVRVLSFVIFSLLCGCASRFPSVPVTKEMADAAKLAVLSNLRDPSSAQFGDQFAASRFGSAIRICGMVNARNGFGGYTGPQTFATIYDPATGEAVYEFTGGDNAFACSLTNASTYSRTPPADVLARHGVGTKSPNATH